MKHPRHLRRLGLFVALSLCALAPPAAFQAQAAQSLLANKCLKCHGEFNNEANIVAGDFESRSNKAKSIAVRTNGDTIEVIKFTPETTVENAESVKALKKPIPVKVYFQKRGPDMVATKIVAKPQIKVPAQQQLSVEQVAKLVAEGPEKGKFVLVDSRPAITFQEGHIPGAVSMPFPMMPKMMGKVLPKDKSELVVFYCGGFR